MKTEFTSVNVSRETKELLDKLVAQETKRTGYKIRGSDIVMRAISELSTRIHHPSKSVKSVSVKKVVKRGRKFGQKWTPAQKAKFKATMAAKRNNNQPNQIPEMSKLENIIPDSGLENQ